jgi:hypothetical protein
VASNEPERREILDVNIGDGHQKEGWAKEVVRLLLAGQLPDRSMEIESGKIRVPTEEIV